MPTQHSVLYFYLWASKLLLKTGNKAKACCFMSLALGECNRKALLYVERRHVLRALSHARRIAP